MNAIFLKAFSLFLFCFRTISRCGPISNGHQMFVRFRERTLCCPTLELWCAVHSGWNAILEASSLLSLTFSVLFRVAPFLDSVFNARHEYIIFFVLPVLEHHFESTTFMHLLMLLLFFLLDPRRCQCKRLIKMSFRF